MIHSVSTLVHCRECAREYGGARQAGRAGSLPPPAASSTATLQPHPPTRPHCDLRLSHTRVRMAGLQPHPPILQRHLLILQPHPSILRCIRLCYDRTDDVATKLPPLPMTTMLTPLAPTPTWQRTLLALQCLLRRPPCSPPSVYLNHALSEWHPAIHTAVAPINTAAAPTYTATASINTASAPIRPCCNCIHLKNGLVQPLFQTPHVTATTTTCHHDHIRHSNLASTSLQPLREPP